MGGFTNEQINKQTNRQIDKQKIHMIRPADKPTNKQKQNKQPDKHTNRQTDKCRKCNMFPLFFLFLGGETETRSYK